MERSLADSFRRVKRGFKGGKAWSQGILGNPQHHCLIGGINLELFGRTEAVALNDDGSYRMVQEGRGMMGILRRAIGQNCRIDKWNDVPSRTWEEVDAVLGACIELAEREEAKGEVLALPERVEKEELIHA